MKKYTLGAALLAAILAAASVGVAIFWRVEPVHDRGEAPAGAEATAPPAEVVELSSAKIAAAGLELTTVARRRLQPLRRVQGRLQYDESNHVAVRAPSAGVLIDVLVKPGDPVTKDQTLARLSSKEIGEARADFLCREEDLRVARIVEERDEQVSANVQALADFFANQPPLAAVEKQFEERILGDYRAKVIGAYSQLLLAEELFMQGKTAAGGALSGVVQQERRGKWEVAKAEFQTALETALFESARQRDESVHSAEDARRRRDISRRQLELLSGGEAKVSDDAQADLSLLEIISPVTGAVEQRRFSRTERVQAADELFVIADPKTLWVAAAVRENEWAALNLSPGAELSVETAGIPDRRSARLIYVGREVSPDTHAVPLMASLVNEDGLLRPGMYATVSLPLGPPVEAIAVPLTCIMQHEGKRFVFVAAGRQSFRRVAVETGLETDDLVEIRRGLTEGQQVVDQGAFVLKSELLLEREAE